jgi:ATP-dependent Clp protease ATP-binding subunit ClpX
MLLGRTFYRSFFILLIFFIFLSPTFLFCHVCNCLTDTFYSYLQIDTTDILFVCGGAFSGLQDIIARRTINSSIGFNAKISSYKSENTTATKDSALFGLVEPGDVVKYGLIPEFVGRFPLVVSTHALDTEQLVRVLKEPRNALYRQYRQMFAMRGIELVLTDDALEATAELAMARNTGARGLRSILERALLDAMFDVPSMPDVHTVYVDGDAVRGVTSASIITGDQTLEAFLMQKEADALDEEDENSEDERSMEAA